MLFHSGLEDSQALWEIAIRKREASRENQKVISQKYSSDKNVRERAIDEVKIRLGRLNVNMAGKIKRVLLD